MFEMLSGLIVLICYEFEDIVKDIYIYIYMMYVCILMLRIYVIWEVLLLMVDW
jgi:hypothetical protein